MHKQYVAGGVGRALMFVGDELWGIANTLTDNTFDFTITSEDIRGGKKNALLAKYFHDSNLSINLVNALFNFDDIALVLGSTIEQGGTSFKEEPVSAESSSISATEQPITVYGKNIGWYKKVGTDNWKIGTFVGKTMSVPGAQPGDRYCLKYFWNNPDARFTKLRADYEPAEIHLVIIQDLFNTEVQKDEVQPGAKAGSLITDIPRFKLDGNENLAFTAGSTATTSLTGNAMGYDNSDSCEEEFIYGTMTEEIYSESWQDRVIAVAVENGDVELEQSGSEELNVRVIYGGNSPAQRKENKNFTFAVEETPASTASGTKVSEEGVVKAGMTGGTAIVSVKLKDAQGEPVVAVEPAYVRVTVAS